MLDMAEAGTTGGGATPVGEDNAGGRRRRGRRGRGGAERATRETQPANDRGHPVDASEPNGTTPMVVASPSSSTPGPAPSTVPLDASAAPQPPGETRQMELGSLFGEGSDSAPRPVEPDATTPHGRTESEPAQVSTIESMMARIEHERLPESAPQVRPVPQLPPVQLTLPPDSGLELVETRNHASEPYIEEPQPQRPKRTRPARMARPEEPLEMVETRHDAGDQTRTQPPGT